MSVLPNKDARMKWWREAKFGLFIHWGLYSLLAGKWKGKKTLYYGEWIANTFQIPDSEYSQLAKNFNPKEFDPTSWVRSAKDAGIKYIVLTANHHEGFALFDTKVNGYNSVKGTPFKRDIVKELSAACRKEGLKFGVYYSLLDWHHSSSPSTFGGVPDFNRYYFEFVKRQIEELLTNYGQIDVLFFDADWVWQWNRKKGEELANFIRSLQPNIVINDRIGKRPFTDFVPILKSIFLQSPHGGDYSTIEQAKALSLKNYDWETNITMNNTWGYKSFDNNWKSPKVLIQMLVDIVSKGGNLLLNVGPDGDGEIPEESLSRLDEIGKWLKTHNQSIYGASPGPFQNLKGTRTTMKNNNIYVHIFNKPSKIKIPNLNFNVKGVYLLGEKETPIPFEVSNGNLLISQFVDSDSYVDTLKIETT